MKQPIDGRGGSTKQPYEPPRILGTEKLEGRAVTCLKADGSQCEAGPITS